MIKRLLLSTFGLICVLFTFAQVTTGTIIGTVKDSKGQILSGATIKAVLTTTGSVYTTTSNAAGAYTLPNLRVGGPYTITVNYVGHNQATIDNLTITLGNTLQIDPSLEITGQTLTEVQVTGSRRGAVISSVRNGASLNVSSKQMLELPTINRSITDFARLMPQANNIASSNGSSYGVSFGGQSNRYNQFSIDGINSTDGFGLTSSGTNGGQANLNPIPLEAIQEMQIALSPYDITQGGFTGGGMNAITRSGTNTFHGSAYGFGQTQALIGKSVFNNTSYPPYKNYTWGASLGGAIIKNKLFFYVNYERFDNRPPSPMILRLLIQVRNSPTLPCCRASEILLPKPTAMTRVALGILRQRTTLIPCSDASTGTSATRASSPSVNYMWMAAITSSAGRRPA